MFSFSKSLDEVIQELDPNLLLNKQKNLKLEVMKEQNLKQCLEVITKSYLGTKETNPEPVMEWGMGPEYKEKFDDEKKKNAISYFMEWTLLEGFNYGSVVGIKDTTKQENNLLGIGILLPPGQELGTWSNLMTLFRIGKSPPAYDEKVYNPNIKARFESLFGDSSEIKNIKKNAPKHVYVYVIAVLPSAQGKGVAKQIFQVVKGLENYYKCSSLLECAGEKNPIVYQKIGYQIYQKYSPKIKQENLDGQNNIQIFSMIRENK